MSRDEFKRLPQAAEGICLYVWDYAAKATISPLGIIPWPVVWLLSFHYKHVFGSAKKARVRDVTKSVSTWLNNLRWRIHHRKAEEYTRLYEPENAVDNSQFLYLLSKLPAVRGAPSAEQLEDTLQMSAHGILSACKASAATFDYSRADNTCGLVRVARQLMASLSFDYLKTDKDGGFAAVLRNSHLEARADAFVSQNYNKVSWYEGFEKDVSDEYRVVCDTISRNFVGTGPEKASLWKFLLRDLNRVGETTIFQVCSSL